MPAEKDAATRNVLLGTAAIGVLGALVYAFTRPTQTAVKNPALGSLGFNPEATTNCSSYLPSELSPTDEGTSGTANALASYGACQGQNALVNAVFNSSIVQSIENAIEEGTIESAQLIGLATLATQIVGEVAGISVVAATSVMPIVGAVLTAVIAIADWINSLGSGPQIYVPNPNASGGDSITVPGIGKFEKINLSDYGGFVQNAMNWVHANPASALAMTPQELSNNFSIFLTGTPNAAFPNGSPSELANNGLLSELAIINGQNVYQQLAQGNPVPPGAYEILRSVQLPAAAAVCAAMPTKAGYLTNNGGTGGTGIAPLQTQFPALTTADMQAIFTEPSIQTAYDTAIANAQNYVNAQCPPLTDPTVLTKAPYNLALSDAVNVLTQWAPLHPCSGYQAPIASPGPQQCVTIPSLLPGLVPPQTVCIPGPASIVPGSSVAGFTPGTAGTTKTGSTLGTVAKTGAVAAGALGVGLLAYKLYTGYTFATTLRSAWSDTKKIASKVKGGIAKSASKAKAEIEKPFHRKGRRSNPLVLNGRTSATGGRTVAYRVRMDRDVVEFTGDKAVLYRNEAAVATFKPSSFQKTKIRSGQGEVLVFKDQLT